MAKNENCFCHFAGFAVKDATARKAIEDMKKIFTATPETLQEILMKAPADSTIKLLPGEYGLLEFKGNKAYPENLTITTDYNPDLPNVSIAGVRISSGINQAYYFQYADISESIMPKGLTFRNLYFTDDFILRNCGIDGLSIAGCYFGKGAVVSICPNDLEVGSTGQRYLHAATKVKNLLIRGCTFVEATDAGQSAILALEVDGATIYKNNINNRSYNAIQIGGRTDRYSTGQIDIVGNTIIGTTSRSMRISNLKNAQMRILSNLMYDANMTDDNREYIKASGCVNASFELHCNKYKDAFLDESAGSEDVKFENCTYSDLPGAVANLENQLADHSNQLFEHKSRLSDYATHIASLNETKTQHSAQLTQHETQLTQHETQLTQHSAQLTQHADKLTKLEAVNIRNGAVLSNVVSAGGKNLTYLQANFANMVYMPSCNIVFFEAGITYEGSMAAGETLEFLIVADKVGYGGASSFYGATTWSNFAEKFEAHIRGDRLLVTALNDVNVNDWQGLSVTGWYFCQPDY